MYSPDVRVRALALLAAGRSLSSVSAELGVSRATLRDWREHGGEPAALKAACFVCAGRSPESPPSYARLLGYYLGDGCLSSARTTWMLRVSCDAGYPGIIAAVTATIQEVRVGARVQHVSAPGTVVVQSYWNHWPCQFPQHGPGRKHERRLELAPWQEDIVAAHPAELLRGLFHSDGCRVNNWATRLVAGEKKRYDYPRWQFVNASPEIRAWCCQALDRLGVAWRQSGPRTISVSTRAGVATLDRLVGAKS